MAKQGKKKKKGGCLTAVIVIVLVIVIIIIAVIMGPISALIKFAEAFLAFFEGETPEEELYEWVVVNSPELDISLGAIENSPYDTEAIKEALKCEVSYIDNTVYAFTVESELEGRAFTAQYNMQSLTANYGTPWQLLLAVCTASEFDSFMSYMSASDEELETLVTADDVSNANSYFGSKISYITDYSEYWLQPDTFPSYEEFETNCVTDLSEVEGKYTCIYKTDSEGYGVYYPVVCLDSVSTWLYDYEFSYELELDDEGRPIKYSLKNIKKTTNVERFLENLEDCGVGREDYETFKFILGLLPYATSRGLVSSLDSAYNSYMVNNTDRVLSDFAYDESMAIKEYKGDIYTAATLDEIKAEWMPSGYTEPVYKDGVRIVDVSFVRRRCEVATYASKFVHAIYEMPAVYDAGNDRMRSYVAQNYRYFNHMSEVCPDLGRILVEQSGTEEGAYENDQEFIELLKAENGYSYGMLYGMSDWDFVVMVLADTLYFDVSSDYLYNDGLDYKDKDNMFSSAVLTYPFHSEEYQKEAVTIDGEHKCLTTTDSFYDLVVNLNKMENKNKFYIIDATEGYISGDDAVGQLKVGDLGMEVVNGNAYNVGIYVGKVDGHDAFVHLGGGSTDLVGVQSSVEISYLESSGAIHPDGGTVDYNTFIRLNIGSYPLYKDGKYTGGFVNLEDCEEE